MSDKTLCVSELEINDTQTENESEVDVPRFVRLEVDVIETRRYTKIVSMPEEYANRLIGKLWANDKRAELSEADCIAACMETPGQITREVRDNEIDTIDVLDIYEPNSQDHPPAGSV